MTEKKKWFVIWPAYLDKKKTRRQGRRLPLQEAIAKPTTKKISEALQSLGIECITKEKKLYPRSSSWMTHGCVYALKTPTTQKKQVLKSITLSINGLSEFMVT
jgi:signal recognition particle subunit SRP19